MLTYKDRDGIVKLSDSEKIYSDTLNRYSDNGYFIEAEISAVTKIILFIGQHYGTDLSKSIIFAVTGDEVKLVYNQQAMINSIAKTDSCISMVIQSNIPEVDVEPVTHTIWSVDGILKFKDN